MAMKHQKELLRFEEEKKHHSEPSSWRSEGGSKLLQASREPLYHPHLISYIDAIESTYNLTRKVSFLDLVEKKTHGPQPNAHRPSSRERIVLMSLSVARVFQVMVS